MAQRNATPFDSGLVGKPGKRVALVIGNKEYRAEYDLPPLKNPVNDADDIGAALRGFGFDVVVEKNLDRGRMLEVLERFRLEAGGAEAALFYFAGHGQQERNKNYLMPIDGRARNTSEVIGTGIDVNEQVLAQLEGSTKITIALLDACRSSVSGKARGGVFGLADIERPDGSVIAYATAPGKIAAEVSTNGRNGLWTEGLLKAFKGSDLSLDGVLYAASLETQRTSGGYQRPHSNGDDILKKQFHFSLTVNPGTVAVEQSFWDSIKDSTDPADFEAYVKKYPKGNYKELAENRIRRLRQVPPAAATPSLPPVAVSPAPSLRAGQIIQDCAECPELVVIPAGSFEMGSNEGDSDEKPVHTVSVRAFALGKTEVTVGEFRRFVKATGYRSEAEKDGGKGCYAWDVADGKWDWRSGRHWDNPGFAQKESQPAVCVSWNDAQAYVEWIAKRSGKGYRLPSEAEWEYAARAGSKTARPWGDNPDQACTHANVADQTKGPGGHGWSTKHECSDGYWYTAPVGSFRANGFGLYDMIGNVWEWVEDCWNDSYKGAPGDESVWKSGDCGLRVLRGGAWFIDPQSARSANRYRNSREIRYNGFGFRLARMLP